MPKSMHETAEANAKARIDAIPNAGDRINARHLKHRQEVVAGMQDLIEQIEDNEGGNFFTKNPYIACLEDAILLIDSIE